MAGEAADAEPVFSGSQGATSVVAWIDRVLADLRDGRLTDARALLEGEAWRALDLKGIPLPIRNQLQAGLQLAAEALATSPPAAEEAEETLLIARARFLPGA